MLTDHIYFEKLAQETVEFKNVVNLLEMKLDDGKQCNW